jgi:hypothetical protein
VVALPSPNGDQLTEHLNPGSNVYFAAEPSADLSIQSERA